MKPLQIAKFDLPDGHYPNDSILCKYFQFHPNLYRPKAFLICPDIMEAVGPYPNAPNLPKCFYFYPKPE